MELKKIIRVADGKIYENIIVCREENGFNKWKMNNLLSSGKLYKRL